MKGLSSMAGKQAQAKEVLAVNDGEQATDVDITEALETGFHELAAVARKSSVVFQLPELVDKGNLIGVPFVLIGWRFNPGEYANQFVSVLAINEHNELIVFNDGSTGICMQLQHYSDKTGQQKGPIYLPNGLRRSEYWRDPESGETFSHKPDDVKTEPARTFYLS